MHLIQLGLTLLSMSFYSILYSFSGGAVLLALMLFHPVGTGISLIFSKGYERMYLSSSFALESYLTLICSIYSGVFTFQQAFVYTVYSCLVYLGFHIYQLRTTSRSQATLCTSSYQPSSLSLTFSSISDQRSPPSTITTSELARV